MKLEDHYRGGEDPFEGDRTLWLRSLPARARVTKAKVILTSARTAGNQFEESIKFPDGKDQGDWSASKAKGTGFCEVDFHARRTLVDITGSGGDSELQVDIGGTLVSIAEDGTFLTPEKDKKIVKLTAKEDLLPSLTVNKIRFYFNSADLNVTSVTIRSVPTNVSMRLADKPPFWMRLGELATAQTSPDFAAVLNAFLADASVKDGYYQIPFIVHSDTIARLDVLLDIDYVIEESLLPSYLPEITLPYGYSSLPDAHEKLLTVKLPRGARPVSGTGGRIQGTFDSSRVVFGDIGESGAEDTIIVSPDSAMAFPIQLEKETQINGIDLPLANTDPGLAGLHLSLQEDLDGTPSGKILVEAEVKVARPVPGGSAWGSAQLPNEFRFLKDKRCWLVVQSLNGQAFWTVEPGSDAAIALLASTDGGFSWRTAATNKGLKPLQAVFRLRFTPEQFSVPVQLQIGRGKEAKRVSFSKFAPLGRVEFDMDFAAELGKFLDSLDAASPCRKGEFLTNGSFDLPPHDDATRRLFGFDAVGDCREKSIQSKVELIRGIDLSKECFIALLFYYGKTQIQLIIDCAGRNPARTWPNEVVEAINASVRQHFPQAVIARISEGILELSSGIILYPWMREGLPTGWQSLPEEEGKIWRLKLPTTFCADWIDGELKNPRSERLLAILEATRVGGEGAVLSQLVSVTGDCTYFLSILFLDSVILRDCQFFQKFKNLSTSLYNMLCYLNLGGVINTEDNLSSLPSWEVRWLDTKGEIIRVESEILSQNDQDLPNMDGMIRREIRLLAPPASTQAEIRFIQPSPGFVLLEDASFAPTYEALSNGSFYQWEVEAAQPEAYVEVILPTGWMRLGGVLEHFHPDEGATYLILMGNGPDDATLAQRVDIKTGEHLRLSVSARPEAPPADDIEAEPLGRRARLELHWLADGATKGEPVILPLDGCDFSTHSWAGEVSAGINGAEIRLIQPRGSGNLLIESVSLRHSDMISVPLIFLSEAPGELTVSNLKVAYELPESHASLSSAQSSSIMSKGATAARVSHSLPPTVAAKPTFFAPTNLRLDDLDIGAINGISEYIANIFRSLPVPIATVAELAALDPELELSDLSRERRLILKASAEMVKSIYLDAAIFSCLENELLATLLDLTAEQLKSRFGLRPEHVVQLQQNLRILKLLLKNDAFRKLSLSDLIVSGRS
jgi:hypothetical protein